MDNFENDNERFISEKVKAFEMVAALLPGIKILQCTEPTQNLFICHNGRKHYDLTQAFFKHLPVKEYRKMIFDPDSPGTCLLGTKEINDPLYPEQRFYIRYAHLEERQEVDLIIVHHPWMEEGKPLLSLTQIISLHLDPWLVAKIKRTLGEMFFRKKSTENYEQLTVRNRDVLSLMVKWYKAEEIGAELGMRANTVNTHKKKIKDVLSIEDNFEILKYGLAFDLISF